MFPTDAHLKRPNVVAVLSYASEGRLVREAFFVSGSLARADRECVTMKATPLYRA
jgi:hypothetical protein